MRQIERNADFVEMMRQALQGWQTRVWTALPGIIESFNATELTAVVQPAIQARYTDRYGNVSWVSLPLLLDVPVVFPRGGGFVLTFPVAVGDECLVVLSSRCIDGWWSLGGVQQQMDLRMHDLSDGFAILGPYSKVKSPNVSGGASTTATQLRTEDGNAYIELTPNGSGGWRARVAANDVELYGTHSFSWSVQGYGERWTWDGGSNFTHSTWQTGAVVTPAAHNFNPPDIPEGT